jgi:hypothetical protein
MKDSLALDSGAPLEGREQQLYNRVKLKEYGNGLSKTSIIPARGRQSCAVRGRAFRGLRW